MACKVSRIYLSSFCHYFALITAMEVRRWWSYKVWVDWKPDVELGIFWTHVLGFLHILGSLHIVLFLKNFDSLIAATYEKGASEVHQLCFNVNIWGAVWWRISHSFLTLAPCASTHDILKSLMLYITSRSEKTNKQESNSSCFWSMLNSVTIHPSSSQDIVSIKSSFLLVDAVLLVI